LTDGYDDSVRALVRTRRRRVAYWAVVWGLALVVGVPLVMFVGGVVLQSIASW
jgi:hypothetical protein